MSNIDILPSSGGVSNHEPAIAFDLGFESGVLQTLEMVSEAIQNVSRRMDPLEGESVSYAFLEDLEMVLDLAEEALLDGASS